MTKDSNCKSNTMIKQQFGQFSANLNNDLYCLIVNDEMYGRRLYFRTKRQKWKQLRGL